MLYKFKFQPWVKLRDEGIGRNHIGKSPVIVQKGMFLSWMTVLKNFINSILSIF